MNKEQFLNELRSRLNGLPKADLEERLFFYGEMIDDRVEDGLSEEEAVAGIGTVDEIVDQILEEVPLSALVKEKVRQSRGLKIWEIVLIVLGFPLWLPLLISAFAIGLSLYIVLWSIMISIWAIDLSLAASAVGGILAAVWYLVQGNPAAAGFSFGAGVICAGLAVLLFYGCVELTKALIHLTKKMVLVIKNMFIGKETGEQ
ncbi:MAG: DUF1700 domain-containing protein [Oscillospiraceae bacterium]|nr:DUF1700 domain-containing protein [Oscillospiraceae bacterium]